MEHKVFRIFGLTVFLLTLLFAILYDVFTIKYHEFYGKLMIKLLPTFFMMSIPIFYYIYYRITIYSLFIHITLFFFLLGDIFIGLYDSTIPYNSILQTYNNIYLILGGSSFLFGRFLILFAMMLYPASRFKMIKYETSTLLIIHFIFVIPSIAISFLFINKEKVLITISVILYIVLGFGFQLSYSFLRISTIDWESKYSSIFAFIGVFLFNLSDFLLLMTMFTKYFPSYFILLADNIYWLSILLLAISVVRSPYVLVEKGSIQMISNDNQPEEIFP